MRWCVRMMTGFSLVALVLPSLLVAQSRSGVTRMYYVAAEEVNWDYVPSGKDQVGGRSPDSLFNTMRTPGTIGRVYKKAIYREYTDGSFTKLKPRPKEWEHLGILGPLLRAEVGDTIKIVFRNKASRPYSMHPHGVIYDKDSEGALYEDGTSGADKADDSVPPGGTHTYVWPVPERAGPVEGEGSSAFWMYHSHVVEGFDVNAGLIGAMIVTARGMARPDGSPKDVDREIVTLFAEFDELGSWYLQDNIKTYVADTTKIQMSPGAAFGLFSPFHLSNFMETVNGFGYGNTRIELEQGQRVRWYVFAKTNFGDLHAPHWHGNVVKSRMMRTDVLSLTAMEMVVADMVPDNPGTWLFHCHVREHNDFGMQALFTVNRRVAAQ